MKFKNPMLVVKDLEITRKFYKEVLGLRVIMDLGSNVTFTGGVSAQTEESWLGFIQKQNDAVKYKGNNSELYFEEDNFEDFIAKIDLIKDIEYVHPVIEHSWGQRAIRFYDPDGHIIEVGENLKVVCKRFLDSDMSIEDVAKRMDIPIKFAESLSRK